MSTVVRARDPPAYGVIYFTTGIEREPGKLLSS